MSDSDSENSQKQEPEKVPEVKSPIVPKLNLLAALPENRSSTSSIKSIKSATKEDHNPFSAKNEVKEEIKIKEERPPQMKIMTPKIGAIDYSNLDFLLDPTVDFDPN